MSTELAPGFVLDEKYTLVRVLGSGATGMVWLARTRTGAKVACKVLHPHLVGREAETGQLKREAEVLAQLRHENIVRHLDFGASAGQIYQVLEYIDGYPLDDVLGDQARRGVHFKGAAVRSLFGQLCEAVEYAHEHRIIHRDIKPQNVLIAETSSGATVKVLDFGHARLLHKNELEATTLGRPMGSPFYMSPEQYHGQPATTESDVFSLATILFEMITLHRAWVRDEQNRALTAYAGPIPASWNSLPSVFFRIAVAPRPRPGGIRPGLVASLEAAIERALAVDPSQRPGRVDELRAMVWPGLMDLPDSTPLVAPEDWPPVDSILDELEAEAGIEVVGVETDGAGERPSGSFERPVPTEAPRARDGDAALTGDREKDLDPMEVGFDFVEMGEGLDLAALAATNATFVPSTDESTRVDLDASEFLLAPTTQPGGGMLSAETMDEGANVSGVSGDRPFAQTLSSNVETVAHREDPSRELPGLSMTRPSSAMLPIATWSDEDSNDDLVRPVDEIAPRSQTQIRTSAPLGPTSLWTDDARRMSGELIPHVRAWPDGSIEPARQGPRPSQTPIRRAPTLALPAVLPHASVPPNFLDHERDAFHIRLAYRDVLWAMVALLIGLSGLGLGLQVASAREPTGLPPAPAVEPPDGEATR